MSRLYDRREILSMFTAGAAGFTLGLCQNKPTYDFFIILDDVGETKKDIPHIQQIIKMGLPATIAILPDSPWTQECLPYVESGKVCGLLHLPMQPVGNLQIEHKGRDNGIYNTTLPEQVPAIIDKDYQLIRGYELEDMVGYNNHTGSSVTQKRALMEAAADFARAKRLIVIDSRTIGSSVMYEVMKEKGVITGQRRVFLDQDKNWKKRSYAENLSYVTNQLRASERIATREGSLIAIGHIKNEPTIQALENFVETYDTTPEGELIKDLGPCILRLRSLKHFRGL